MKFIGDVCYGKSEYPEQYLDIYLPDANSFKQKKQMELLTLQYN